MCLFNQYLIGTLGPCPGKRIAGSGPSSGWMQSPFRYATEDEKSLRFSQGQSVGIRTGPAKSSASLILQRM